MGLIWLKAGVSPLARTGVACRLRATHSAAETKRRGNRMWLILLEAGIALALLIFLVYWTMRGKK
jgi:hypothetical protein